MESLSNMGATTCTEHPEKPNHKVSLCFNNLDYPLHVYAQIKKKINKHVLMVWPESTSIPDPTLLVKITPAKSMLSLCTSHNTKNLPSQPTVDTQFNVQTTTLSLSDCVCASQFKFRLLLSDPFCFLDMPYYLGFSPTQNTVR